DDTKSGHFINAALQNKANITDLFSDLAQHCLKKPGEFLARFEKTWKPVLFQLFQSPDAKQVVQSIKEIITSDDINLNKKLSFADLKLPDKTTIPDSLQNFLAQSNYQLPAGILFISLGLYGLIEKLNLPANIVSSMNSNKIMESLFSPLMEALKMLHLAPLRNVNFRQLFEVFSGLLTEAEEDEAVEWALLKMARFPPVGIFLVICAVIHCLIKHPLPWWDLLFADIEKNPKFKVKRLPPPSENGPKYLIFSDIHRDSHFDELEPMAMGSIDHFKPNQRLYCRLLDYALKNGYTVIEAGDCEELWFFRDFSKQPKDKLREIISTHWCIYRRLIRLHRQGRYVRLHGNHDCCVRKPSVFKMLQDIFDWGKGEDDPPFEIYDFAIIEEVKTMDDMIINFGLDSEPYKTKAPMIVAHGHQWDFWNCDCNNLIGKLIVSAVVTPLDMLDDPLRDMGGIAWGGSPAFKFTDMLSKTFILESFLSANPAAKFAHEIQHQKDDTRYPIDSYMFMETLAAFACATIGVRKNSDAKKVQRLNLFCLGHTHFPQSQPYFNLEKFVPDFAMTKFEKIKKDIQEKTNRIIDVKFPYFKSRYFNSGTAGWMEGVVWAIQIEETGQARQVYWTRETQPANPNTMDWELPLMDPTVRERLNQCKGKLLKKIEDLSVIVNNVIGPALEIIISMITLRFNDLFSDLKNLPIENHYDISSNQRLTEPLALLIMALFDNKKSRKFTFEIKLTSSIQTTLETIGMVIGATSEVAYTERIRLAAACLLTSRNLPLLNSVAFQNRLRQGVIPELGNELEVIFSLALLFPAEGDHRLPLCSKMWIDEDCLKMEIQTYPPVSQFKKTADKPEDSATKKSLKQQIKEAIEIFEKYNEFL
ncbi:hypothetical protein JW964_02150, partial [candidate division KSB1 bacterium]|nr:hypothetical protein [candidate division KSB1 bacterium]